MVKGVVISSRSDILEHAQSQDSFFFLFLSEGGAQMRGQRDRKKGGGASSDATLRTKLFHSFCYHSSSFTMNCFEL